MSIPKKKISKKKYGAMIGAMGNSAAELAKKAFKKGKDGKSIYDSLKVPTTDTPLRQSPKTGKEWE